MLKQIFLAVIFLLLPTNCSTQPGSTLAEDEAVVEDDSGEESPGENDGLEYGYMYDAPVVRQQDPQDASFPYMCGPASVYCVSDYYGKRDDRSQSDYEQLLGTVAPPSRFGAPLQEPPGTRPEKMVDYFNQSEIPSAYKTELTREAIDHNLRYNGPVVVDGKGHGGPHHYTIVGHTEDRYIVMDSFQPGFLPDRGQYRYIPKSNFEKHYWGDARGAIFTNVDEGQNNRFTHRKRKIGANADYQQMPYEWRGRY